MSEARQPVWDIWIRLFHWTLGALIGVSWWTAETGHLDWHLYSGLGILSLIIFRVLWGFFGSSTARFSNFVRGPSGVLDYLRDSSGWRMAGHTPLGALSVLALLCAVAIQVGLGLFSVDEDGLFEGPLAHFLPISANDRAREIHGIWFWLLVGFIALHVAAIIFYRLRGKPLTKAMITGETELPEGEAPMTPGKWWVALLCLAAGIAFTRWLVAGFPTFGG